MTKELTPEHTIEMLQRERDSLLDRIEGLQWMVDQMNKDSETMVYDMEAHGPVYAAVAYTFGPRCDDYDSGCPGCEAWAEYDGAAALRAESERLEAENKAILAANRDVMLHWDVLKADYERLRAALEQIVRPGGADDFWQCYDIARAALNGQPTGDKHE